VINSLTTRIFDYSDFEKKLRHYFTDSAPINADIIIGLRDVRISCQPHQAIRAISYDINENISVIENVKNIINVCIDSLYPRMIVSGKKILPFTDDQKKTLLFQGFTVEQIHEKEERRTWVRYILVRFNEHNSTIDYIDETTKSRYRAHLYQPLMMIKDRIWTLSSGGKEGMEELYRYIMSISKQERLDSQKNKDEECYIQESS
jgi:hypothetical protein